MTSTQKLLSPLGPLFRQTGSLGALTESDVTLLLGGGLFMGICGTGFAVAVPVCITTEGAR